MAFTGVCACCHETTDNVTDDQIWVCDEEGCTAEMHKDCIWYNIKEDGEFYCPLHMSMVGCLNCHVDHGLDCVCDMCSYAFCRQCVQEKGDVFLCAGCDASTTMKYASDGTVVGDEDASEMEDVDSDFVLAVSDAEESKAGSSSSSNYSSSDTSMDGKSSCSDDEALEEDTRDMSWLDQELENMIYGFNTFKIGEISDTLLQLGPNNERYLDALDELALDATPLDSSSCRSVLEKMLPDKGSFVVQAGGTGQFLALARHPVSAMSVNPKCGGHVVGALKALLKRFVPGDKLTWPILPELVPQGTTHLFAEGPRVSDLDAFAQAIVDQSKTLRYIWYCPPQRGDQEPEQLVEPLLTLLRDQHQFCFNTYEYVPVTTEGDDHLWASFVLEIA